MKMIKVERTASRGIAIAPVYRYCEVDVTPDQYAITASQAEDEIKHFHEVKAEIVKELGALAEENPIFAAHMEIAEDFTFTDAVETKIRDEGKNVQVAIGDTTAELSMIFEQMDDEYMRERSADIVDVGKRFLIRCKGIEVQNLATIDTPVILVARDLFPSDTVHLKPAYIKGIITQEGGITSHVSIMAKNHGIPILTGVEQILSQVEDNMLICMDAAAGKIVIDPDTSCVAEYEEKMRQQEKELEEIKAYRGKEAKTKDGKRIMLCVNVGNAEEIKAALDKNIDGIGLFRSEFLYMENRHFPTEEEQFAAYKEAALLCPKEVTIRTLDIGGDKKLPYYTFEPEENPFLGWRAIRISLDMKDMFVTQLRAILRASAFGHIRIMFPMMISLEELREAKGIVEECKEQLRQEKIAFDEQIELGMMMETPASVLLAEEFAKEADFFSIGTNDLTQYVLAVDRGNQKIASRYDSFHPAVIKAIQMIIDAGHREGITVGMCGEMAGDRKALPILLKLGLDEFSMSAGNIDYIRKAIIEG